MEKTREYIRTLHNGINIYLNGVKNVEQWKDNEDFIKVIESETTRVEHLQIVNVGDEIYKNGKDGITFYLNRLDEPFEADGIIHNIIRCSEVIKKIETNGEPTQPPEGKLGNILKRLHRAIIKATNYLIEEIEKAKQYLNQEKKNPIVEKALEDRILLDWFFDDKNELENYIKFCLSARTPTEKARRAGWLAKPKQQKIKMEKVKKPLWEKLESLGIEVGKYSTWRNAT